MWVVFLDESGECWTFENPEVRLQKKPTMGRLNGTGIGTAAAGGA